MLFYFSIFILVNAGSALVCFECKYMRFPDSKTSGQSTVECIEPGRKILKQCAKGVAYCRAEITRIEPVGISEVTRSCWRSAESSMCPKSDKPAAVFSSSTCRFTCSTDRCNNGTSIENEGSGEEDTSDDDDNSATLTRLHLPLLIIPAMLAAISLEY